MKPSPCRFVIYRTQDKVMQFNNSKDHPAVITRVHSDDCVNLKVVPDLGPVYDASLQVRIDPKDESAQGWFFPPRV